MTIHTLALADRTRGNRAPRASRHGADDPIHLLPVPLRQLRLEVLRWAMHMGVPVDADSLTCILLAKQHQRDPSVLHFTADAVRSLLWIDILSLCADLERRPPEHVATTFWTLLDYLDRHDRFDPQSDALAQLREPLIDSGGLRQRRGRVQGGRTRHPAAR
jgi:hypothetical protein